MVIEYFSMYFLADWFCPIDGPKKLIALQYLLRCYISLADMDMDRHFEI